MKFFKRLAFCSLFTAIAISANAQYYEIANQLTNILSPALSGGAAYKGYVEISGLAGLGDNRANSIGISTSQGFRYSDWFFMGAGLGVDLLMSKADDPYDFSGSNTGYDSWAGHPSAKTKALIPVFSDFRFIFASQSHIGAFIDLKLGAAWLIGSSYLRLDNAYLSNQAQFYMRPTVGVRIATDSAHPNRAFNIGLTYQLLTSGNNYAWNSSSLTLNNLGVTLAYEW